MGVGHYPLRALWADLYQTRNGPLFNPPSASGVRQVESIKVGQLRATFADIRTFVVSITLDEPLPDGTVPWRDFILSRMNFGFGQIGQVLPTDVNNYLSYCWTDLRGEWVFVDQSDPSRPPWRFNFTELESSPSLEEMECRRAPGFPPQTLVFTDLEQGATMYCVYAPHGNPDPGERLRDTCELSLEGAEIPLLWFHWPDAGVKRISASLGGYPDPGILRSEERVVGMRVE